MKSTNYPLPEIAIKSGFNSISTFRRVFFFASFGCSPNKYRVNA
ncbi:helix-turn-helix domain-containing protein [Segatella copri]